MNFIMFRNSDQEQRKKEKTYSVWNIMVSFTEKPTKFETLLLQAEPTLSKRVSRIELRSNRTRVFDVAKKAS